MRRFFILTLLAATASACSRAWSAPSDTKPNAEATAGVPGALQGHNHEGQAEAKPFGLGETNSEYFWRKADVAFHAGDFERTIALHKAIIALDATDVESYSIAAWLMWSLGRGDEALAHIKRGINANSSDWEMWDAAGEQYDLQKQYTSARDAYSQAVRILPPDTDSQFLRRRLAHAAEHAGDLKLAESTWRGLTKDFPNDAVNSSNLSRVEKLNGASPISTRVLPSADLVVMKNFKLGTVRYFRIQPKPAVS